MPPPTKFKAKGKTLTKPFSAFSRGKESSSQLTDHGSDSGVPPSIVSQGESSKVTETHRDTRNATTSALYTENQNNVIRCEHEALDINTNQSSGNFNHAHHFVIANATMVDKSTINYHTPRDKEAKELLLKHSIAGAAHDSSARDPPPRCHPGTRIKINERIMTWFYDKKKQELVLWVYGSAGVGKSAIVQTIAEALATAQCLGASVFFSRPNGRNSSRSVFITIAYQLAVNIEDYRKFISERLASDPELMNKGMKHQFRTFIIEPFVEKKIGANGKTWGILLDGLDELDERHWQRDIIRLITSFALNHPDIPLAWIIASRPEPHILDTFKAPKMAPSYWEEHVPIDSPEACQDVERYLRSSLETIREDFPRIVPLNWPDEMQIAKLALAASGLFAFAEVAARFIENPNHADPASRLHHVLSAIDGSVLNSADNRPFTRLDALYIGILSFTSPEMWPVTKRVLGAIVLLSYDICCVKGLSILLGFELSKIYTSINDLYSVLKISLDDIYSDQLSFYHASFVDFLTDVTRSREFYISLEDASRDLDECGVRIWLDFKRKFPRGPSLEYRDRWSKYASKFHSNADPDVLNTFNTSVFNHIHIALQMSLQKKWDLVQKEASHCHWNEFLELLSQVDGVTASVGLQRLDLFGTFLFDVWKICQDSLSNAGIMCGIRLEQLQLDHLQWQIDTPTHAIAFSKFFHRSPVVKFDSYRTFTRYISGLKYIQQRNPELQVLICGPMGNRFAMFIYKYVERDFKECPLHLALIRNPYLDKYEYYGFYCMPHPDNV